MKNEIVDILGLLENLKSGENTVNPQTGKQQDRIKALAIQAKDKIKKVL